MQPIDCFVCRLIEAEENTEFSHVGIVWKKNDNEIFVLEAMTKVKVTSLHEYLQRTAKNRHSVLFRNKEIASFNKKQFDIFKKRMLNLYFSKFHNLKYDSQFLWDNVDENGDEKIYCSELVAKLLNPFLHVKIKTKHMTFEKNRHLWSRFFANNIPDGKEGLGLGDLDRSVLFYRVGSF